MNGGCIVSRAACWPEKQKKRMSRRRAAHRLSCLGGWVGGREGGGGGRGVPPPPAAVVTHRIKREVICKVTGRERGRERGGMGGVSRRARERHPPGAPCHPHPSLASPTPVSPPPACPTPTHARTHTDTPLPPIPASEAQRAHPQLLPSPSIQKVRYAPLATCWLRGSRGGWVGWGGGRVGLDAPRCHARRCGGRLHPHPPTHPPTSCHSLFEDGAVALGCVKGVGGCLLGRHNSVAPAQHYEGGCPGPGHRHAGGEALGDLLGACAWGGWGRWVGGVCACVCVLGVGGEQGGAGAFTLQARIRAGRQGGREADRVAGREAGMRSHSSQCRAWCRRALCRCRLPARGPRCTPVCIWGGWGRRRGGASSAVSVGWAACAPGNSPACVPPPGPPTHPPHPTHHVSPP